MALEPLTPDEAKKLGNLLQQIEELSRKLNKNINTASLKPLEANAENIKVLFKSLNEEWQELNSDIDYAADGFKRIVDNLKNTDSSIKLATKSFNNLSSIAEKVQFHQKGISDLSKGDLKILKQKSDQEQIRLQGLISNIDLSIKQKKSEKDDSGKALIDIIQLEQTRKKINEAVGEGNVLHSVLSQKIGEINKQVTEQNKLLGLGGNILNGATLLMDKFGLSGLKSFLNFDKAKDAMNEMATSISQGTKEGNKFSVLTSGVGSLIGGLKKVLFDPLTLMTGLVSGLLKFDTLTGEIADGLGLSHHESAGLANQMNSIANSSGNLYLNSKNISEAFVSLNKSFGTTAEFSAETLGTFTQLKQQLELSNEAATAFVRLQKMNGGTLSDTVADYEGQVTSMNIMNGTSLNLRDTMEEIKNISAATALTLGNTPQSIATAVYEAKRLGFTLDTLNSTASSLLDFESSISSQIEAEVLTGRQLNLEQARYYALTGDVAGLAKEVSKNIGDSANFTKMNVIQQEALAKSVGMTRDSLAKTLIDQEVLTKLHGKGNESAQQAFARSVKEVGLAEAKRRLGNEELSQQFAAEDVQKRMASVMEKFSEVLLTIAEPLLPLVSGLVTILGYITKITSFTSEWIKKLYLAPVILGALAISFIPKMLIGMGGLVTSSIAWLGNMTKGAALMVKNIATTDLKSVFTPSKSGSITEKIKSLIKPKNVTESIEEKAKDSISNDSGDIKDKISASPGEKTKSSLSGLGDGLKKMSGGQVTSGIGNLALFGPAGIMAIPSIPFLFLISKIDGKQVQTSLDALGRGLEKMSGSKTTEGIGNLALFGPSGLIANLGVPFLFLVSKLNGKQIQSSLDSLGKGLNEMSGVKITAGIGNLALFGIASVPALLSIPFLATVSLLGKAMKFGLEALGQGLSALGEGAMAGGWIGVAVIAALGVAMIPFGYALNLAAPAIKVMADAFLQFFDSLSLEKIGSLALLGPALVSASIGIASMSLAMAGGGISSGINKIMGGGIIEDLVKLSSIAPGLNTAAQAINSLADGVDNLSTGLKNIDTSKLESLNDLVASSTRNSVIQGIGAAVSKPLEVINNMMEGNKSESYDAELKEIKALLKQILVKNSDVVMDGNKVGKVLSTGMATYKTQ